MRYLKARLFITILLCVVSGAMSLGAEQTGVPKQTATEPNQALATTETSQVAVPVPPSVVAHFHLSGALSESEIADPFGLTAGQVTSLRNLTRLMEKAGSDDEVKAVILTFDRMSLGFGQLEELRGSINRLKEKGKKVYVHAEGMDILAYSLLCAGDNLSVAPQSTL